MFFSKFEGRDADERGVAIANPVSRAASKELCLRKEGPDLLQILSLLSLLLVGARCTALAGVEVISDQVPQSVFGGGPRLLSLQFRNPDTRPVEAVLRYRLYQASAATLAPLHEVKTWKTLPLLAGQTSLEKLEVDLPEVRGETAFHVVWFDGEKKLATTQLRAFPDGLLKTLAGLAGDAPVGLLDPEQRLKPAFKGIPNSELKEFEDVASAEASLIIIAPMSAQNATAGLAGALKKKAARGAAIVWIQPPARALEPRSSAYIVNEGGGNIVIAQASLVEDLSTSPRSQLNLIWLSELATGRKKLGLPADSPP